MSLLPLKQLQLAIEGIKSADIRGHINENDCDQRQDADHGHAAFPGMAGVERGAWRVRSVGAWNVHR
ncbi:MAG: hypothetical protein QOJ40_2413 [Verrucomicrobiota bacterium]